MKKPDYEVDEFSFENLCESKERLSLEKRYIDLVEETDIFNRKLVSYQANKKEGIHNWLKYKEGFSSALVEILLNEFNIKPGDTVMDPFMGSGTTMLASEMNGINSIGFDILPLSKLAIMAKSKVYEYDLQELELALETIQTIEIIHQDLPPFKHLNITKGAFSDETEANLMFFTKWVDQSRYKDRTKNLLKLCLLNILEQVSFTGKDGQYLRWDYRSEKVIKGNERRINQGKEPFKTIMDKGVLPEVREALAENFSSIVKDIEYIQSKNVGPTIQTTQQFIPGSVLFNLPNISSEIVDAVITSPPYCNRYDYTRTYALELAYLNTSEKQIRELRQSLLTCTVENKPKKQLLKDYYISINQEERFNKITHIIESNKVLQEINVALDQRKSRGEINNSGVLQMVDGYFTELAFTFFELFRVCKSGARVAFVNDNVRYAGEVIPVDFLSTAFAEVIGFRPVKIYTLKQRKGNSSQQMKKFGRVPLRKSITVWEKP